MEDYKKQITRDEALVKLREAVFKTKGLCNNEDALRIAMRKDSTVDDIVRLGAYKEVERNKWSRPLSGGKRIILTDWYSRVESKRKTKLVDTCMWRFIENAGLRNVAEFYGLQEAYMSNLRTPGGHITGDGYRFNSIMRFAKSCGNIPERFTEEVKRAIISEMPHKVDNENDLQKDYNMQSDKFYKKEVEMLVNMPDEVAGRAAQHGMFGLSKMVFDEGIGKIRYISPYYNDKIKMAGYVDREKVVDMMNKLEYMGIGIIGIGNRPYSYARKGLIRLPAKVSSLVGTFNQMIKKGLDVDIVREEIASTLEAWLSTNCRGNRIVYIRTDASNDYDIVKSKAKSSSKSKTDVKEKVVTTITVNGTEMNFVEV